MVLGGATIYDVDKRSLVRCLSSHAIEAARCCGVVLYLHAILLRTLPKSKLTAAVVSNLKKGEEWGEITPRTLKSSQSEELAVISETNHKGTQGLQQPRPGKVLVKLEACSRILLVTQQKEEAGKSRQ
jgi:hypothetical protein